LPAALRLRLDADRPQHRAARRLRHFNDIFPATVADNFATNSRENNTFVVSGPLSPAMPGNVRAAAAADNTSFLNAFAAGGTVASIAAANPGFSPPSYFSSEGTVRPPRYQEWNLE